MAAGPNAVDLPVGSVVNVCCVDDAMCHGMYGARGVVVGTCMYTGYTEEHDAEGNLCDGEHTLPATGYTLCMVMSGTVLHHSLQNVPQGFVKLVKPGSLASRRHPIGSAP